MSELLDFLSSNKSPHPESTSWSNFAKFPSRAHCCMLNFRLRIIVQLRTLSPNNSEQPGCEEFVSALAWCPNASFPSWVRLGTLDSIWRDVRSESTLNSALKILRNRKYSDQPHISSSAYIDIHRPSTRLRSVTASVYSRNVRIYYRETEVCTTWSMALTDCG